MLLFSQTILLILFHLSLQQFSLVVQAQERFYKASPGSAEWPFPHQLDTLNSSVSGRLLKPTPPGAVCHPDQFTYESIACPDVLAGWQSMHFHI